MIMDGWIIHSASNPSEAMMWTLEMIPNKLIYGFQNNILSGIVKGPRWAYTLTS